jgi:hypothetical protein
LAALAASAPACAGQDAGGDDPSATNEELRATAPPPVGTTLDPDIIKIPPDLFLPRGETLTQHNNRKRTGANLEETTLTPANVTPSTFGRLYTRQVDGQVLAQPLYAKWISVLNPSTGVKQSKNIVYVATAHNTIYAFDAAETSTSPTAGILKQRTLESPQYGGICGETWGPVGVSGTPVIDKAAGAMYVVARAPNAYWIHKLELATLNDVVPPVRIAASVPDTDGGSLVFDATVQRQRPGLLLVNGVVYVGFGTYSCDEGPYHGWVLAYDGSLNRVGAYATTPHRSSVGAGIWQSGGGLVADDAGDIYFETGNGTTNAARGDLSEAFVKLHPRPGLANILDTTGAPPANYIVPNSTRLNDGDVDLGSGAPMMLPGNKLMGGGKQGVLYLLDTATLSHLDHFQAYYNVWHSDFIHRDPTQDISNPGQYDSCATNNECFISVAQYDRFEKAGPNIHGGHVYWDGVGSDYGLLYAMPEKEYVKAFRYHPATATFDHPTMWNAVSSRTETVPALKSNTEPSPNGMPGGMLSLSANGTTNGIVWSQFPKVDSMWDVMPGRLVAYDASNLHEIWRDDDNIAFAKFNPVTVGDGKVFRPTFGMELVVYGLKSGGSAIPCYGIDQVYMNYGAQDGELGTASTGLTMTPNGLGWFKHYAGGSRSIYWTSSTCAHEVHGAIRGRWEATGWETFLGFPTTDETATPDNYGRYNHFQYGSIYWTPRTGAWEVHGDIRGKWAALGWERNPNLGYPITNESTTPDTIGRFNHFEKGSIYWTPSLGAHEIHGPIKDKWSSMGWETSWLGYPTTDVTWTGTEYYSRFQHGTIHYVPGSAPTVTSP